MSTLYDSDDPLAIPAGVKAAGYIDGYAAKAWAAVGFKRFPDALRITVFGNDADAADVESGDMTPGQAGPWVVRQHAVGRAQPWVYCNRSNGPAVEASLRVSGIARAGSVWLWVATDDGTKTVTRWVNGQTIYYPVIAVQYANSAISGGHYDLSEVYDLAGAAPGGDDMSFTDQDRAFLTDLHSAVARIEGVLGTAKPDLSGPAVPQPPPGQLQEIAADADAIKAVTDQIAAIK